MSPSSAAAHQWAVVAPTFPAPMMVIFARRMGCVSDYFDLFCCVGSCEYRASWFGVQGS